MTRRQHARSLSRRALVWHVFYGSEELIAQGSVLDMSANGCRVTGCMPVEAGTRLRLCIWPSEKNPTHIIVVQGTVRWQEALNSVCYSTHICRTSTQSPAKETLRILITPRIHAQLGKRVRPRSLSRPKPLQDQSNTHIGFIVKRETQHCWSCSIT